MDNRQVLVPFLSLGMLGRDFDAEELATVYGWRHAGEPDATRFNRQLAVW